MKKYDHDKIFYEKFLFWVQQKEMINWKKIKNKKFKDEQKNQYIFINI